MQHPSETGLRGRPTEGVPSKSKEEANSAYNFPGIPVGQIFEIYGDLCGKKLVVDPSSDTGQTVRIVAEKQVTRSEAMQLIEQALRQQAHLAIKPAADGCLSVVPMPAGLR